MKIIVLDFNAFESKQEVHAFLQEKLQFPAYYGRNLDALFDLLSTLSEDTALYAIASGREFEEGFLRTMKEAAEKNSHFFCL